MVSGEPVDTWIIGRAVTYWQLCILGLVVSGVWKRGRAVVEHADDDPSQLAARSSQLAEVGLQPQDGRSASSTGHPRFA